MRKPNGEMKARGRPTFESSAGEAKFRSENDQMKSKIDPMKSKIDPLKVRK